MCTVWIVRKTEVKLQNLKKCFPFLFDLNCSYIMKTNKQMVYFLHCLFIYDLIFFKCTVDRVSEETNICSTSGNQKKKKKRKKGILRIKNSQHIVSKCR